MLEVEEPVECKYREQNIVEHDLPRVDGGSPFCCIATAIDGVASLIQIPLDRLVGLWCYPGRIDIAVELNAVGSTVGGLDRCGQIR